MNVVNRVLIKWTPRIEKVVDVLTEGPAAWLKVAGAFLGAATVMRGAGVLVNRATGGLARLFTRKTLVGGPAGNAAQTLATGKAAGAKAAGMGKGAALGGVGVGIAAVGTGAGLFLAAKGISALADSMSKLDKDQAEALQNIGMTLAITFPLAAVGMALAGKVASSSAIGIGIITVAVLGLGAAIGMATAGIGRMAEGLANLRTAKADSTVKMVTAMKGSKEDFKEIDKAVKSISKADLSNLNPLAKLGKVFSKPLQVEFANDRMNMVADISLNIDGATFHTAVKTTEWVINHIDSAKKAKGALLNA